MDLLELLAEAFGWTGDKVAGVREPDLPRSTPLPDWDVARLLDHLIADMEAYRGVVSGDPVDLVGSVDPTLPENVGHAWPDPSAHFDRLATEVHERLSRPGALQEVFKTSRSDVPGLALVNIILIEIVAHGWDIANATDQGTEMPADAAEVALAFATQAMKGPRIGFGEPVPVPEGASLTDRLVGWLGRTP